MLTRKGKPWERYREEIVEVTQDFALMKTLHLSLTEIKNMDYSERMKWIAVLEGMAEGQDKNG